MYLDYPDLIEESAKELAERERSCRAGPTCDRRTPRPAFLRWTKRASGSKCGTGAAGALPDTARRGA